MVNPVAATREVALDGRVYRALVFKCPGCVEMHEGATGLHMLPVDGDIPAGYARWDWDGNVDAPTLSPSILTKYSWSGQPVACHSFMRAGRLEFLSDCTHPLAGQTVPLPPLEDWMVK